MVNKKMKQEWFKVSPFWNEEIDKWIEILGPTDDLRLKVDFDDVDHRIVRLQTKKMLLILNEHWGEYRNDV